MSRRFQILSPTNDKLLRTVTAQTHPHAAADYWKVTVEAVTRESGWGGRDGRFRGPTGEVFVREQP